MRLARVSDIPELAVLAAEFHSEAELPSGFSSGVWQKNWSFLLERNLAVVLVEEVNGMIAGTIAFIVSRDLNDDVQTAEEAFWFQSKLKRGSGIKLLKAMEAHLKRTGIRRVFMIHLACLNDRLGRIYERMDYRKVETRFVKHI